MNLTWTLHRHLTLPAQVAVFLLICLAAFRLTRLVTTDTWPPMLWLRSHLISFTRSHTKSTGPSAHWPDLFTCPWCFGTYATLVTFCITWYFVSLPLPLLQFASACAIVGYLGTYDGG